ncbi:hypothetical protein BGX28_008227 [Mortierella sp. GBA30]|nr:hypothetical protein BGX28_008227 [Mortierella sp. GBA30]
MVCYKNTQCVPVQYFCDSANPCTDVDGNQDPEDPILCQDQLCVPTTFRPLPSPGDGKVSQISDCAPGSYYSLFGSTPKYTLSCVETYPSVHADCKPWEYLAQSSCFLSTCGGPNLDCQPPFVCTKTNSNEYGICSNPDGSSGDLDDSGVTDGGSTGRYSSREYLLQGLLIGICSLVLGVGLGVGFCHYRRKRFSTQWSGSERGQSSSDLTAVGSSSSIKRSSWLSALLFCGGKRGRRQPGMDSSADNPSSTQNRDSFIDSESHEGSFEQRRSNMFSGRWRWGPGSNPTMSGATPGATSLVPEMEPPPLYHSGPDLPTYNDSAEDIALSTIHTVPVVASTLEQPSTGSSGQTPVESNPLTSPSLVHHPSMDTRGHPAHGEGCQISEGVLQNSTDSASPTATIQPCDENERSNYQGSDISMSVTAHAQKSDK